MHLRGAPLLSDLLREYPRVKPSDVAAQGCVCHDTIWQRPPVAWPSDLNHYVLGLSDGQGAPVW
jgi:hypothetical protein